MATRLHLDFETASEADLKKVGTSQYARHRSTRVLMLAWAFGDEDVEQWLPEQGPMPERLRAALTDPEYVKIAWNKTFEYAIFKHVLGIEIPHDQWRDSMVLAFSLSLPGSLDKAGKVVGLPLEQQKLSRGKNLIRKFCVPRKPTKTKPWTWNTAETDPADWEEFKLYNRQDVEAERAIWKRLRKWNMPAHEWRLWFLDQEINERGIPINRRVVENAIRLAQEVTSARLAEMSEITGLDNPNSGAQLLTWLREEGYRFEDLKKGHVDTALKEARADDVGLFDPDYARVLELRQEVSKASVKKYAAISAALDPDDRLRHTLQFAGAGRTWRWSGRRFQPQNLARPVWYLEKTQEQAVRHLERLDPESIEMLYPKPMDLLSTCVRPVVQAPEGFLLIDADLNAIENRVVGWLAGDKKILRVFEEGRCPYLDFATKMFVQPYDVLFAEYKRGEKFKRTQAKPAVLGCGYMLGGGEEKENPKTGEIEATGLLGYAWSLGVRDMTRERSHESVRVWRETYTDVVEYWWELDRAARRCIQTGETTRARHLTFDRSGPFMRMILPSGRALHYCRPKLIMKETPWGEMKEQISYEGLNDTNHWSRITTHPGKLVENATQAVARDLLAHGMMLAHQRGLDIFMHVHDQIVGMAPIDRAEDDLEVLRECMSEQPDWAKGLPLAAEGFTSPVFIKD